MIKIKLEQRKAKIGKFIWEQKQFLDDVVIPPKFLRGIEDENYIAITQTGLTDGGSWILEFFAKYGEVTPGGHHREIVITEDFYMAHGFLRVLDNTRPCTLEHHEKKEKAEIISNLMRASDVIIDIAPYGWIYEVFAIEDSYLVSTGEEWAAIRIAINGSGQPPYVMPLNYYVNGNLIKKIEAHKNCIIKIRKDKLYHPELKCNVYTGP